MKDRITAQAIATTAWQSDAQDAVAALFEAGAETAPHRQYGTAAAAMAVAASRALLESMSDGAVLLTEGGDVLGHNRRFAEMLNRPAETLAGEPFVSLFAASDRGWIDAVLSATAERGTCEATLASGGRVRLQARRIQLPPRSVICLTLARIEAADDGTHARRARLPRQPGSAEAGHAPQPDEPDAWPDPWHAAFDALDDLVFVHDRDGRILRANRAFAARANRTPGEIIGQPYWEVFALPRLGICDRAMASGATEEQEIVLDDGRVYLARAFVVRSATGKYRFSVHLMQDITARQRTEQQRRRSEAQYRAVTETSVSGFCVFDSEGRLLEANDAFVRLVGYARDQLVTMRVTDLDASAGPEEITARIATLVRQGSFRFETTVRRKDGRIVPVEVNSSYWPMDGGRIFVFVADISARKEATKALRLADNVLLSIIDNAESIVWVKDIAGQFLIVNRYTEKFIGRPRHELLGRTVFDLFPREFAEEYAANDRRVIECGEAITVEERIALADGDHTFLSVKFPLRDARGRLYAIGAICTDITERKQAEIELMRFSQIFEHLGTPVVFIDHDFRYSTANPTYAAMFNRTPSELIGQKVVDILGAESFAVVEPHLKATLAGERRCFDLTRLFPDGVRRIVNLFYRPFVVDGAARGVVVSMHDVTELRTTQEALQAHQQRLEDLVAERSAELREQARYLRALIDNFPFPVWLKDTESRYLAANRANAAAWGLAVEDVVGKTDRDLCPGAIAARRRADDRAVMASGEQKMIEEVLAEESGVRWIETWKAPVVNDAGAMLGTVGFTRDITERKANEAAREAALAEAERLARVRRQFLANVSHEIRTPLNAVLALAQLGQRECYGRAAKDRFERIHDAGQFLLGIVDDILDLSRIEAGKLTLEQVPFSLGDTIDRAVAIIAQRAYAKPLDLRVEEAIDLPARCRGDSLRLSGILVNLLSNAVKFTPEGGRVVLSVGRDDDRLVFRVEDSGVGMAPDQVDRLFRPFEQADGSTTRRFGGTGLGLAICKHLVTLMGGDIRVETGQGVGSAFEVRIPLAAEGGAEAPAFAGPICVTGIAPAEADALVHALRARATPVDCEQGMAQCAALVVGIGALASADTRAAVDAVLGRGGRVAVVVTPGQREIPEDLRERVCRIERPLRARQIQAVLAGAGAAAVAGGRSPQRCRARLDGYVILAVEDNEVNRLVVEEVLTSEGARVTCLAGGREALARLRADGPDAYDLVLTDIQMPEMDGYETARRIGAIDRTLPVVGLTAHAMAEERARCLAAGMVEHVAKPIDINQLVAVVQRHARPRVVSIDFEDGSGGGEAVDAPSVAPAAGSAGAPARAETTSPVDWAGLNARFGGRVGFIGRLAATVREAHAQTPQHLRTAAEAGDLTTMTELAHSLKGMAGNIMATPLVDLARRTERAARAGLADAPFLCLQLAAALDELLAALGEHFEQTAEGRPVG